MANELMGKRIAFLATDGVEEEGDLPQFCAKMAEGVHPAQRQTTTAMR